MRKRWLLFAVLAGVMLCIFSLVVYNLPPINERLSHRFDNLQAQVYYYFNPPEEAVFVPQEQQIEAIVQATLQALPVTLTAAPSATSLPSPTIPGPTPTP